MVEVLLFCRIIPVDVNVSDGENLRGFVKCRLLEMIARARTGVKITPLNASFTAHDPTRARGAGVGFEPTTSGDIFCLFPPFFCNIYGQRAPTTRTLISH